MNRRGQAMAHNNLARIYLHMAILAEAMDHSRHAVALAGEVGDRRGESSTLATAGMIHHHLGDYAIALDYHRRALALTKDTGDFNMELRVREELERTVLAAAEAEAAQRS